VLNFLHFNGFHLALKPWT